MNLYLLTRTDKWSYDDFDSFVAAHHTKADARQLHPDGRGSIYNPTSDGWPTDPAFIEVKLLGTATFGTEPGVICASFNAG